MDPKKYTVQHQPQSATQSSVKVTATSWPNHLFQLRSPTVAGPPIVNIPKQFLKTALKQKIQLPLQKPSLKLNLNTLPNSFPSADRIQTNHHHHDNGKHYQVLVDVIGEKNRQIQELREIISKLETESQSSPPVDNGLHPEFANFCNKAKQSEKELQSVKFEVSYLLNQNRTYSANADKLTAKTMRLAKKLREVQSKLAQRDKELAAKTEEAFEQSQHSFVMITKLQAEVDRLVKKNQGLVGGLNAKCNLDELNRWFIEKSSRSDAVSSTNLQIEQIRNTEIQGQRNLRHQKMERESESRVEQAFEFETGQLEIVKVTSLSSTPSGVDNKDKKGSCARKRKLIIVGNNGEEPASRDYDKQETGHPKMMIDPDVITLSDSEC